MEITKEQVQEYIKKNYDSFFVSALSKCIKEIMFPNCNKENQKEYEEEYKEELKQLIYQSISYGVKEYLEDSDLDFIGTVFREIVKDLSYRKLSISFD